MHPFRSFVYLTSPLWKSRSKKYIAEVYVSQDHKLAQSGSLGYIVQARLKFFQYLPMLLGIIVNIMRLSKLKLLFQTQSALQSVIT